MSKRLATTLLAALASIALTSCEQEVSRPVGATPSAKSTPATASKKAGGTDEAPRVLDPMKDGY